MVAPRITCIVVEIPVGSDAIESRLRPARELLPGADPYIAALIRKLQDEVREERAAARIVRPINRITKFESAQAMDETIDFDPSEQDWPLLRDM